MAYIDGKTDFVRGIGLGSWGLARRNRQEGLAFPERYLDNPRHLVGRAEESRLERGGDESSARSVRPCRTALPRRHRAVSASPDIGPGVRLSAFRRRGRAVRDRIRGARGAKASRAGSTSARNSRRRSAIPVEFYHRYLDRRGSRPSSSSLLTPYLVGRNRLPRHDERAQGHVGRGHGADPRVVRHQRLRRLEPLLESRRRVLFLQKEGYVVPPIAPPASNAVRASR
jgi:hypothetical protein